jgi:hypothetical protein
MTRSESKVKINGKKTLPKRQINENKKIVVIFRK